MGQVINDAAAAPGPLLLGPGNIPDVENQEQPPAAVQAQPSLGAQAQPSLGAQAQPSAGVQIQQPASVQALDITIDIQPQYCDLYLSKHLATATHVRKHKTRSQLLS